MSNEIKLSIRTLAEFILRGGSIDSRFSGLDRAAEGSRIHRMLQKRGGKGYKAEVPLALTIEKGNITYHLSGRADGLIEEKDSLTVDEIKTVTEPLDAITEATHPEHWGQAACYAHILCTQRGLQQATLRLTYYNVDTNETRRLFSKRTAAELSAFVDNLLGRYHRWAELQLGWAERRNASLQALPFPFDVYRGGQRDLAIACYQAFRDSSRLFACAPTGIGKTVSTLFPAMKAIGEGMGERMFYLTAKTVTRRAAEDTLALLRASANGPLHFHSITLTAKDKVCFLEKRACVPELCEWANGYYDRVNDVLYEILNEEAPFTREAVEGYARRYSLCPYELSLDLSSWCDCIIGDYNYLFDPIVHLQRFFEGRGGDNIFLIDEAHNLVDRSRDMYSASLRKASFYTFKKQLPKSYARLHKALTALNRGFVALRKRCEEENTNTLRENEVPEELIKPLERFTVAAESFLEDNRGSEWENDLLELYFESLFYTRITEEYGDHYTTLVYRHGGNIIVRLLCLDASAYLDASMDLGRAAVLFSATLQPLGYYREVLGGCAETQAKLLELESPFPQKHLGLYIADDVSTKYTDREASLPEVCGLLAAMVAARAGHYIAYFPSYSYMHAAAALFEETYPDVPLLIQQSGMDEAQREAFLAAFEEEGSRTLLGFCVLGGIFAEGVDLAGDRLIGTAVVGVGLPQIGPEPDAVRDYFNAKSGHGYDFAYQFPGMNKVLQAAGRVIRSDTDRGVVLLIDSRFTTGRYLRLFPKHWSHWQQTDDTRLPAQLDGFWGIE